MANAEKQICPQCGAPLDLNTTACKYCGAENAVKPQNRDSRPQQQYTQQASQYIQQPNLSSQQPNQYMPNQYAQQAPPYMQQVPPQYIPPQASIYSQTVIYNTQDSMTEYYPYKQKSKVLAGILAILFGWIGIHKFYTGHVGWGVVYVLFFWTYIPAIVGLIEGIVYLCTSNENFNLKYVKHKM